MPVEGAYWAHPAGPGSSVDKKQTHPAVHISYNDAVEYCAHIGGRLPTEHEWEYAARGGHRGTVIVEREKTTKTYYCFLARAAGGGGGGHLCACQRSDKTVARKHKSLSCIMMVLCSVCGAEWWMPVEGAYWAHPAGPGSSVIDKKQTHPAVHISYNDAVEYCSHIGGRLPTEHEWEYAARGGHRDQIYPWGNDFKKNRMNIWEGDFPTENKGKDGFIGVSPVRSFNAQNDFGLYDMVGNVWEWTSSVFGKDPHTRQPQYALRGGSYIDSKSGKFNHKADVTTSPRGHIACLYKYKLSDIKSCSRV
eukprot:sb/3467205/